MLLESESKLQDADEPDWVKDWLEEQAELAKLAAKKNAEREAKKSAKALKTVNSTDAAKRKVASKKTADKRARQVADGLDELKIFLSDFIRVGIANLDASWKMRKLLEERSKRLIDAKAPGVASMVAKCGSPSRRADDWREEILGRFGRLALLIEAYSKIDDASEDMASEIRQTIGWTIPKEDVLASGERVEDRWFPLGSTSLSGGRFQTKVAWMLGERSGRLACVLDFSPKPQNSLSALIAPSVPVPMEGALRFYPGTIRTRAIWERVDACVPIPTQTSPASERALTIPEFFESVSEQLGLNPWLERFPALLRDVVVRSNKGRKFISNWGVEGVLYDSQGRVLPVVLNNSNDKELFWNFVAASSDRPIAVFGEWDENKLNLLSAWDRGRPLIIGGIQA